MERSDTHLVMERSDTHLVVERSDTHLVMERSDTHLVLERSDTHLVESYALAKMRFSVSASHVGYFSNRQMGIASLHPSYRVCPLSSVL